MNLNQVSLAVNDLTVSIAFYQQLGQRLIVRSDGYARFEMPEGDATLSLIKSDSPVVPNATHVCFECSDLDALCAALAAAGIVFKSMPEDTRWLWREAWLEDPSGNLLCLFWAGENRKNPPWRLTTKQEN